MLTTTYDPEADAVYIEIGRANIDRTEEVAPSVFLDLDQNGRVVGIEVLSASRTLVPGKWTEAPYPRRETAINAAE